MHGDVKPSNIMLSPDGHATLLDLGFARRTDETGSAVDRCVLGTFHYIAPEFLTSAIRADVRSDIYSLARSCSASLPGDCPLKARTWPTWPRSTSNRSRPTSAAWPRTCPPKLPAWSTACSRKTPCAARKRRANWSRL